MKTPFSCLAFSLTLLPACLMTPQEPANVALSSSGDLDTSSGDTSVFTSTVADTSSSGDEGSSDSTGDMSTSSAGDTSTSSDGDSTSTTGEAIPACRYGDPAAVCRVFVSSGATTPDLGVDGLHALCGDLACNASASGCGVYRALVRTPDGFFAPFAAYEGTYVLPSGAVVAQGVNGLQSSLPINEDETGAMVPNKEAVWTGAGDSLVATCPAVTTPWASGAVDTYGMIGFVGGAGETWYTADQVACNGVARVYCVEVPEV